MKKLLIVLLIFIIVIFAINLVFQSKAPAELELIPAQLENIPEDLLELSRDQIIQLLETNPHGLKFVKDNPDFVIQEKTVLTEELILEGREGSQFREIYEDLELQANRYLKVNLMNELGNKGMVAVLDLENQTTPKAIFLLLTSN